MIKKFSRRDLLKVLAAAAGSLGLGKLLGSSPLQGAAQEMDEYIYLPVIFKSGEEVPVPPPTIEPLPTPTSGKVVHVHSEEATFWNGVTDYWNYVDQNVVNEMVGQGVMRLTGATTVVDAWQVLLPNYQPGQGIAVKVNFNNGDGCDDADSYIDALIQPVNAIIRDLKQIGVVETDIWIYDAIRSLPDRFITGCLYPGIRFFDANCREPAGFGSSDPFAQVVFSPPSGTPVPPLTRVTDVVINATYLINMPIVKKHGFAGLSLSFKNHLGTIDNPSGLHNYIGGGGSSDYTPLVDLYQNHHIVNKTILTVGDGLFAGKDYRVPPSSWTTFNNQVPNSLFFATDPVAIDCVMCDFLAAEAGVVETADNYLRLADKAGLGEYERGNPWGSGYLEIDYLKIEL